MAIVKIAPLDKKIFSLLAEALFLVFNDGSKKEGKEHLLAGKQIFKECTKCRVFVFSVSSPK